jgi:hypothetical protein
MLEETALQHKPVLNACSTLAGLEAAVGLVDNVNPALAAHDPVVAVTRPEGLEGVAYFHRRQSNCKAMPGYADTQDTLSAVQRSGRPKVQNWWARQGSNL